MQFNGGTECNWGADLHVIFQFTSMAYFRGRSIDDAVLIIDEAQNMTRAQMKGMLSRGEKTVGQSFRGNLHKLTIGLLPLQALVLVLPLIFIVTMKREVF